MERYCATDQSPQRAVVPMQEEEEGGGGDKKMLFFIKKTKTNKMVFASFRWTSVF